MQYIGKLNINLIGKYKNEIKTNEVVLTDERLKEHILVYHKKDYEEFHLFLKEIIENPDYIIEDNKHIDTLIFLKELQKLEKKCRIVVKLALGKEEEHPKNSIITMMKQNNRTWEQTIRNRGKILWQKLDKKE